MATDENLTGSDKVQRLQRILHAKAKAEPELRFHALYDKVWRMDFLTEAYRRVRRNGGAAGVDGETFEDVEAYGAERWLGELARELKEKTYTPEAVRQVLIPKKQKGRFRPLGIPCLRDRVVQTSAMMVLSPIFEADLADEQYAYRAGSSANDAVSRIHSLLNTGHHEVVDADLTDFFGQIPHAELMKSLARRISDGVMLRLIRMWLEMAVEEEDGKGGRRRTNRAKKQRRGSPQGSPISPLLSSIYMRRFIVGWKHLGLAQRFQSHIVNYADDICIVGKAPAAVMLSAFTRMMDQLKLPVNMQKTRCLRCPDEALEFLGYRIGTNYRPNGKGAYIGTRPSRSSVQSICRKISEQTARRYGMLDSGEMVRRLNWMLSGWANHFHLGQVSPAYAAIDAHTERRLRQWLCRKHKVRGGGYVRFSHDRLYNHYGLTHLKSTTTSLPWANA